MKTMSIVPFVLAGLFAVSACGSMAAPTCGADGSAPATPTMICESAGEPAALGPAGLSHTITVSGVGVATSAPDVVTMMVGVQSRNADAAVALAENQAKLGRIRAAFAEFGMAAKDIQIASYSLNQQAEMDPMTGMMREPTGFIADNTISVALRDPARVNEALGKVFAAGATSIQNVGFMLNEPQRLAVQARDLAMADAQARAEQMARAAGVTLGRPLSIQEQGGSTAMFPDLYGMAMAPLMPTPGQLQHSLNVTVSYRIP